MSRATEETGGDGNQPGRPPPLDDSPLGRTAKSLSPALEDGHFQQHLKQVLARWGGKRQPMTDLLRKTYEQRGWRPVFLDGLWPGEAAAAMVKAVREVPSHGLPSSYYRPKALLPLHDALALDPGAAAGTLSEPVGDNDRLADLEWQMPRTIYKRARKSERVPEVVYRPLRDLPELPELSPEVRCLLQAAHDLAARDAGATARAEQCASDDGARDSGLEAARSAIEARREHEPMLALLDAMLLQAFYQWVLDFSIDYRFHPFRSLGPVNRARLPTKHRDQLLAALGDEEDGEAFARRLIGHLPTDPDYARARQAMVRYVELMDTKRVESVRIRGQLEKGATGDAVTRLQERLAAEGYLEDAPTGDFDDATHGAVVRYQETHQLAPGGVVGAQTAESLDTPFDWRVKQILVALGRYRESPIAREGAPDLYILVNLPGFELEVVEGGETTRRHKVIVGSNRRVADPTNDGIEWHQRRTKIFDTKLTQVVLNPTWIVPEAIRIDEIEPKALASPTYLEENRFSKVGDLLVQGPAETNPLGQVKFTLETTDSIYLHDTDKRLLFRETVRDLSHGCIRVHEPEKLAAFVLGRQGVGAERIRALIKAGNTRPVDVDDPIPISIEYRTVGFTKEGEPIFYRDIYQYDVAYWKKRTPITRRFP